jgi:hypothetical protein
MKLKKIKDLKFKLMVFFLQKITVFGVVGLRKLGLRPTTDYNNTLDCDYMYSEMRIQQHINNDENLSLKEVTRKIEAERKFLKNLRSRVVII